MSTSPAARGTIVTEDGLRLYTQKWIPKESPDAVVALVHGYAEHCGRYDTVASTFIHRGAAVYAYDQRGYGRSQGMRAYVDNFDDYLDDLALFLQHVRTQRPNLPLFVFGHSMGGLIVLKYALDRSLSARGLMLNGPAIEINPSLAPFLRWIAQFLGRLVPTLPTTRSPEDAISRDPTVVEEAKDDPLNYHGRVLARTGAEMLRAGEEVRTRMANLKHPFLVLHGTADSLASPEWSRRLYEQAAAEDKTLKLYEGLYHETYHEPEKDEVLRDLGDWLSARMD